MRDRRLNSNLFGDFVSATRRAWLLVLWRLAIDTRAVTVGSRRLAGDDDFQLRASTSIVPLATTREAAKNWSTALYSLECIHMHL